MVRREIYTLVDMLGTLRVSETEPREKLKIQINAELDKLKPLLKEEE